MKKLFLASSFADVCDLFAILESDSRGKSATVITTASIVESSTNYVTAGMKALDRLGIYIDILEISTASDDEIKTKIENNDLIYVTGGNSFFLLQELKRTGADKYIINEINDGKPYIGEAAGAIVMSPNILYANKVSSMKKAPNLTDYTGLNMINFYPIPHYETFPHKKVVQNTLDTYSTKYDLIPITDLQAILVEGSKWRIEKK